FIDPDAGDVGIALCDLLRILEAVGPHDREAGDGIKSERQILCSSFGNFSAAAEMSAHVDDLVFHGREPFAPGCHDFWRGLLKSVVQQHKFFHWSLLAVETSFHWTSGQK